MKPNYFRYLFAGILIALLGGCKIQITAPQNGSVTTASGSYNCASGTNCEVPVIDLFFDETFEAVPNNGYTFLHWRTRNRGFCGGKAAPCRLFTSGFDGNDALMAFLGKNDEVFYLEPVFEQDDISPVSNDPASACLNPDLTRDGTVVQSRYKLTSAVGHTENDFEQRVDGVHIFNGISSQRLVVTQTGSNPEVNTEFIYYFAVFNNNRQVRQYGGTFTSTKPSEVTGTLLLSPFRLDRWDLEAGESFTQSYNQTLESTLSSSISNVSQTTTYLGIEVVTVPAGRIEACKFVTRFNDGDIETQWFAKSSGILIKSIDNDITQELVSSRINGVSI